MIRPMLCYNSDIFYMDIYLKYYKILKYYKAKKIRQKKTSFKLINLFLLIRQDFKSTSLFLQKYTWCVTKFYKFNFKSRLGRSPIEKYIAMQTARYFARLHMTDTNHLLT